MPSQEKAPSMSMSENREAEFLARITTGTTHEIRNVLAIVQESAGLIEDMVRSYEKTGALKPDRLIRSVERIAAQVSRGSDLMSTLNRFAHSLDNEQERIDLDLEAKQVALLCGRMARQKGHLIQVRRKGDDVMFTINRLQLEMALFAGVEVCLEQLPQPGTVVMHSGRVRDIPTVDFAAEVGVGVALPAPTEASGWTQVVEFLNNMGATVETENVESHFRISFPFAAAK